MSILRSPLIGTLLFTATTVVGTGAVRPTLGASTYQANEDRASVTIFRKDDSEIYANLRRANGLARIKELRRNLGKVSAGRALDGRTEFCGSASAIKRVLVLRLTLKHKGL